MAATIRRNDTTRGALGASPTFNKARDGVSLPHATLPDDGSEEVEHVQVGERVLEGWRGSA